MGSVLAIGLGALGALDEKPAWMKLDAALQASAATGKPILVYNSSGEAGADEEADKIFRDPSILKRSKEFLLVCTRDPKSAERVKATARGQLVFVDADCREIHRIADGSTVEAVGVAMGEALRKYSNQTVFWTTLREGLLEEVKGRREVLVLAFRTEGKDSEETLKALEDRMVARLHDRCTFVEIPFKKDSPEALRWKVTSAPTVVVVNPAREESKSVVASAAGRRTAPQLKALLTKGLETLKPK
jgi:hypothetical protein